MVSSIGQAGMNSYGGIPNGNAHQNLKNKYGVGYEDFGSRPYAQPYPFAITPRQPDYQRFETKLQKFLRFLKG